MKVKSLSFVLVILAFLMMFPVLGMTAGRSPLPGPTHLGVAPSNIVQIRTDLDGEGNFTGWLIEKADGSVTPFDVPAGQVLIVTDVLCDSITDYIGANFSLWISKKDDPEVKRYVYSSASVGIAPFKKTFKDHMTTGFLVPAGYQINQPGSTGFTYPPIIILQGYFTMAQ